CGLAVHVFPIALLALRDPLNSSFDALGLRFRTPSFCDPQGVFTLAAWAKIREDLRCQLIFLQSRSELLRNTDRLFRGFFRACKRLCALSGLHQTCGLAHVRQQHAVCRQGVESGDAPESAHCVAGLRPSLARTFLISGPQKPKAQCCLKDATLEMMILCWTKNGMLHLMVSAMCGQAWCMSSRK